MRLNDRIWLTRKSRLKAATRLEWNAAYSNFFNAYYAMFSVIFAVLEIKGQSDYKFQLLIASVITLTSSVYLTSVRFSDRAREMKECYILLHSLVQRANRLFHGLPDGEVLTSDDDKKEERLICDEYECILDSFENHSPCDYYLAKFELPPRDSVNFQLERLERLKLFVHKVVRFSVVAILTTVPIALAYFM